MRNEFTVHKLNENGLTEARHVAGAFESLLIELEQRCGDKGREIAIVRTKLEEACFFAKKALASRPEFQLNDASSPS